MTDAPKPTDPADHFERLARTHQVTQLRHAAATMVAVARLWERLIDPNDLDGSFERFNAQAGRLILAARTRGELTAQEYYAATRQLSGLDGALVAPRQPWSAEQVATSLHATGIGYVKRRISEGVIPSAAVAAARDSVLRAVKRHALNSGRQRLIDLSRRDPDVGGWARVSDGSPCYFCALLLSRGPVYSTRESAVGQRRGGDFGTHDGCGCSVRLVFRADSSGGWTTQTRSLNRLWNGTDPETGKPNAFDWRASYGRYSAAVRAAGADAGRGEAPVTT